MAKTKPKKDKKKKTKFSTLNQHRQQGKQFIPPFADLPKMNFQSWVNDRLPDYLWAILLRTHLEVPLALSIFRNVADKIFELTQRGITVDITHSKLAELPDEIQLEVFAVIAQREDVKKLLRSMILFEGLPSRELWKQALGYNEPDEADWSVLKEGVVKVIDHQSDESTDCRWLRVLTFLAGGKLRLPSKEIFDLYTEYPHVADIAHAKGSIRATEIALASIEADNKPDWIGSFWTECLRKTDCETYKETYPESNDEEQSELTDALDNAYKGLIQKWMNYLETTALDPRNDTIFGLAFYSMCILKEIFVLKIDTAITGRFMLRALLEIYITLGYLLKHDKDDLWLQYRNYGSGQAKLTFLKLDSIDNKPPYVDTQVLDAIANEDFWMEFLPINVGQWANSDLRTMSMEAGLKDDYDKYYSWTSTFAHAQWAPVRETVYHTCLNPLHRLHRIPRREHKQHNSVRYDAWELVKKIILLVESVYPEIHGDVEDSQ